MRRLLVCAAAVCLLLSGCTMNKGGRNDDTEEKATTTISINPSTESEIADTGSDILYDRCGVTVRATGYNGKALTLTFTNSSDKELSPETLYIEKDGFCESGDYLYVPDLSPGATETAEIDGLDGVGTLKLRFYLSEEYNFVENSLSDVISVGLDRYSTLRSQPLTIPVYEDDRLKISLSQVSYRESSNRVSLSLIARSKTDEDLLLISKNVRCVHEDYFATLSGFLPAKGQAEFRMIALTSNATLGAEALDSITMGLTAYKADDYIKDPYSDELAPLFETEEMTVALPGYGRPENEVPTQLTEAQPLSEFRSEVLSDSSLTEFAPVYADSFSDENAKLDFCFAAKETSDSRTRYHFYFKAANLLDKQIKLVPYGIFNGATASFVCSSSVPAMTEEYVDIRCDLLPDTLLGDLTDAELMIEPRYVDGHDDDSSRIGYTGGIRLAFANKPYRAADPAPEQMLLSDAGVTVYATGVMEINDTRSALKLFIKNETAAPVYVHVYTVDDDSLYSFYGYVLAYSGTLSEGTVSLYSDDDTAPTAEDIDGLKVTVFTQTTDGDTISSGEGVIKCIS